jgi:predicted N-acetyltransferase YhbS
LLTAVVPDVSLELADWQDILTVLKETHLIWSPGLDRSTYHRYIWGQMNHPWARRNYRYLMLKRDGRLVSSCKLYTLQMQSRGKQYKVAGVGAVYTQSDASGSGNGSRLMREVTDLAQREQFDALLLYSDIGHDFYERFGYIAMPHDDFHMDLRQSSNSKSMYAWAVSHKTQARPILPSDADFIERHHIRWLRSQPFGVKRTTGYIQYRLWREIFLHENSRWSWPRLELLRLANDDDGYAILEQASGVLRVLEVVGSEKAREELWNQSVSVAIDRNCHRMRGWSATAPESISTITKEREWGLPMILPLNKEIEHWPDEETSPLLELDHI